jgi:hypothetical protein
MGYQRDASSSAIRVPRPQLHTSTSASIKKALDLRGVVPAMVDDVDLGVGGVYLNTGPKNNSPRP